MSKQRKTERKTSRAKKLPELRPTTAMGRDHYASIFRRTRSRSINSPEVAVAHEYLTDWLNGADSLEVVAPQYRNSPESTERIRVLLELVRGVIAAFEKASKTGVVDREIEDALVVQFPGISRALVDYATVPYLAFQPSSKLWGLGHWPTGLRFPGSNLNDIGQVPQPTSTLRPYGEVMAAHGILELARSGALSRIRQCDCGRWFFAIKKNGVAHHRNCRQKIYDRKPEIIAKRKAQNKNNDLIVTGKIHFQKRETSRPRSS
jgi:hypothetical protein